MIQETFKAKIVTTKKIQLAGISIETSIMEKRTRDIWKQFRTLQKDIPNQITDKSYSVEVYPAGVDMKFLNEKTRFEKWAAVAVSSTEDLPDGVKSLTINESLYANFLHRGTLDTFPETMHEFYSIWLPESEYEIDDRPHFEVMDERYKGPADPSSIEEIYVPVKKK